MTDSAEPLTEADGEYIDPALDGLREARGVLGVLATRSLGELAGRLAEIGNEAHSEFGDRIVILAGRLAELAREARRRLAEDGLPADAGTAAQQERRRAAAADAAVHGGSGLETFE